MHEIWMVFLSTKIVSLLSMVQKEKKIKQVIVRYDWKKFEGLVRSL